MPNLATQPKQETDVLFFEEDSQFSREAVVIADGESIAIGQVLGQAVTGSASAVADAGNTGDGAMGAITVGAEAQPGDYVLTIMEAAANAGRFHLVDPEGDVVGEGNVAAAFSGGGLSFTLADGAADFVVGDFITITVADGTGKYYALDLTGTDGREDAAAVSLREAAPSGADGVAVSLVRHSVVKGTGLVWPAGITAGQKANALAQLEAKGILQRTVTG